MLAGRSIYEGVAFMKHVRTTVVAALAIALMVPSTVAALPKGTEARQWANGLSFGIDLAWVKGTNKMFVTEKDGRIRVIVDGKILGRPCANLDVNTSGERGLLGIALDPNYDANKRLYVYYTNASPLDNRVARFRVTNNRCRDRKVILKGLSAASSGYHNGGQIEFVGGKLLVASGDAHSPSDAQDTDSRLGKILRINPDGSIPNDNPFNNAVWSYGHRNPFGLTHRPGTNRVYVSENGPSCDDELNFIRKGRNYGWGPNYRCGTAGVGSDPKAPMRRWTDIIVPTDPTWYAGRMRSLRGDLYMGDYDGRLHRLILNDRGNKVRKDRIIHKPGSGIIDTTTGPGRWLYFLTANTVFRIVKS
jgi:aldose sugar dehydrogenase